MKTILIIGANSNIGSYLAHQFFEEKHSLILHTHRNNQRIQSLLSQDNISHLQFDVCDYHNITKTFSNLFENKQMIPDSVIITSAERSKDFRKVAETDISLSEKIIKTNLTGTYYLLKTIIPYLRQKEHSSIAVFSSNVSRIGLAQGAIYAATKAAISNLVRSIAKEEADQGIFINAISPGPVEIDDSDFDMKYREFRKNYYQKQIEQIPLKSFVHFEDIYHTIEFLLFKNNYITGEEIFLTGGAL